MKRTTSILFAAAALAVSNVVAGTPTDSVRGTTDKILTIIKETQGTVHGQALTDKRADRLHAVAAERFDWNKMAQLSLGLQWRKRTADERKEFVALFSRYIANDYIGKIQLYFDDLKEIKYTRERLLRGGTHAKVFNTVLTKKGGKYSVVYIMWKNDAGTWLIYDVEIESVRFVSNYKKQFRDIIAKKGYAHLLETIKKKLERTSTAKKGEKKHAGTPGPDPKKPDATPAKTGDTATPGKT
jgi:phospholipid transport system substrate-binding protein